MSNRFFSYSFQIHRTRRTVMIFLVIVTLLVGGYYLFYKSKKHVEVYDRLSYEVVLGMNEFEDNNCKRSYRLNYKESTCGTICVNISKSNKDFLETTKTKLEEKGFNIGKISSKMINKNNWNYFNTVKVNPSISYYAIDYGNKLYSIEIINQTVYLTKTKSKECNNNFNKMINSIKLK